MACFYKADYKTAHNQLGKLIDNLYYLMQISFYNNLSIKVQKKAGVRMSYRSWLGGRETTVGFFRDQRKIQPCMYVCMLRCWKLVCLCVCTFVCSCVNVCYWGKG